jgi:hypothetical protein
MAEHHSMGHHGSARGMAKLAAFMANKGTFQGQKLMSEATWEDFHSNPVVETEIPWGNRTSFTQGGVS